MFERERLRSIVTAQRRGHPLSCDHGDARIALGRPASATLAGERALPRERCLGGRVGRERTGICGFGPRVVGEGSGAQAGQLDEMNGALRCALGSSAAHLEPRRDRVEHSGLDEQGVEGLPIDPANRAVEPMIDGLAQRGGGRAP